jgi:hypothetical protein
LDIAAGICIGCRQRKRSPRSKSRCEVCLTRKRLSDASRRAARAEQRRLDHEQGNTMLRQTLEYLTAERIGLPPDLVELARARGIAC